MRNLRVATLALTALVSGVFSGCTNTSEPPTPSPTTIAPEDIELPSITPEEGWNVIEFGDETMGPGYAVLAYPDGPLPDYWAGAPQPASLQISPLRSSGTPQELVQEIAEQERDPGHVIEIRDPIEIDGVTFYGVRAEWIVNAGEGDDKELIRHELSWFADNTTDNHLIHVQESNVSTGDPIPDAIPKMRDTITWPENDSWIEHTSLWNQ